MLCVALGMIFLITHTKKAYKVDFVIPILHVRFQERIEERSDQGHLQEWLGSVGTQSFVNETAQRAVQFGLCSLGFGREREGEDGLRDTTDLPTCAYGHGLPFPFLLPPTFP